MASPLDFLFAKLGINPEELTKTAQFYANEFTAAKQGFANAMTHFNSRFNTIEQKQDRILALLESRALEYHPVTIDQNPKGNGHDCQKT